MPKYQVTHQTYIQNDGWITHAPSVEKEKFDTRKAAEEKYGRFYDRLPKGKPGQILKVHALWKLEKDGETYDEVVGYTT